MGLRHLGAVVAAVCGLSAAAPARADNVDVTALPMITDRNFAIDVYLGPVLGSGRIVGMGGAAVALAEGSAGNLSNPAAPAVRAATSYETWDWDWHADWLSPQIGSDFDGNGIPTTMKLDSAPYVTAGIVGNYRQWALALTISSFYQAAGQVDATVSIGQVTLARTFLHDQLAVGLGLRAGTLEVDDKMNNALFSIAGSGLEAGAVWKPSWLDLRVGGTVSLPVQGNKIAVDECADPSNCFGFITPDRVVVPWRFAVGGAWRRGPTRWNRTVHSDFRDERALVLAADLVVTGAVKDGYGIEAFGEQHLQRSGAKVVFSPRFGVEYEWKPGWLRIRGGTYYEPGRFEDENGDTVPGRVHATLGADVRIWSFHLWGNLHRVRLSLTSDLAARYGNGGLSIGFWH